MDCEINILIDEISKNPLNVDLYYLLARSHRMCGNTLPAYVACTSGLRLNPNHTGLLYELTISSYVIDFDKSVSLYEQIRLATNFEEDIKQSCAQQAVQYTSQIRCEEIKKYAIPETNILDISIVDNEMCILTKTNIIFDKNIKIPNTDNFVTLKLFNKELALCTDTNNKHFLVNLKNKLLIQLTIDTQYTPVVPFVHDKLLLLMDNRDNILKVNAETGVCNLFKNTKDNYDNKLFKKAISPVLIGNDYIFIVKDIIGYRVVKMDLNLNIQNITRAFYLFDSEERLLYIKPNINYMTIVIEKDKQLYECRLLYSVISKLMN